MLKLYPTFDTYIKREYGVKSLNELLSDNEKFKDFIAYEKGENLPFLSNDDYASFFKKLAKDFLIYGDNFFYIKESILGQYPLESRFFISWIESKKSTEEEILSVYKLWKRVSANSGVYKRLYNALSDFIVLAVERAYQLYIMELESEAESIM